MHFLVLAGAVAAVGSAALLVRWAQAAGLDAWTIAAARLLLAALALAPFAVRGLRGAPGIAGDARQQLLLLCAGGALAVHFASWIASLAYTSVASSVVLVTSHPLWVAIAARLFLREPFGLLQAAGALGTLAGTALVVASDGWQGIGPAPMLGNALALLGAAAMAVYVLLGRVARRRMSTAPYAFLVYAIAGLAALPIAMLAGGAGRVFAPDALLAVIALALVPQLLGHTGLNWALGHVSATMVSVAVVGEPVAAALLAWWLLGEGFAALQLTGFALILGGVVACAFGERARAAPVGASG